MKEFLAILLAVIIALTLAVSLQPMDMTPIDEVAAVLSGSGYAVTVEQQEERGTILNGDVYRLTLDGNPDRAVTVYVYKNVDEARKEAGYISPDGFSINYIDALGFGRGICVEWVDVPHFYQYQNVIVQYIGTDNNIQRLLVQLCGNQIAGGEALAGNLLGEEVAAWQSQMAPDSPAVFLRVMEDSVSAQSVELAFINASNEEVLYGADYTLLRRICGLPRADGTAPPSVEWEWLNQDAAFNSIGYGLPAGKEQILEIQLPDRLEPGEYRIAKKFSVLNSASGERTIYEVWADFTLSAD